MKEEFNLVKDIVYKELDGTNLEVFDMSSFVIKEIDYSLEDIEEVKRDVLKDSQTYRRDSKKSRILSKITGMFSNEEYFLQCFDLRLREVSMCEDYKMLLLDLLNEFALKTPKDMDTCINILVLNKLVMSNFLDNIEDYDEKVKAIVKKTHGYTYIKFRDSYEELDKFKKFFYGQFKKLGLSTYKEIDGRFVKIKV